MKLAKAIEILTDLDSTLPQSDPELRREAVNLGIEALKRIKDNRIWPHVYHGGDLPGETEE